MGNFNVNTYFFWNVTPLFPSSHSGTAVGLLLLLLLLWFLLPLTDWERCGRLLLLLLLGAILESLRELCRDSGGLQVLKLFLKY